VHIFSESSASEQHGDWLISLSRVKHLPEQVIETLFSVGNGYIGTRGTSACPLEKSAKSCEGTYINGAYVREQIHYDESAYGFAQFNNKMLQVANSKAIKLSSAGGEFQPAKVLQRQLDIKLGAYQESLQLINPAGEILNLHLVRFAAQQQSDLLVNQFTVEAVSFQGKLIIESSIQDHGSLDSDPDDPRVGDLSCSHLSSLVQEVNEQDLAARTLHYDQPKQFVCTAIGQSFSHPVHYLEPGKQEESRLLTRVEVELEQQALTYSQYSFYGEDLDKEALLSRARQVLQQARQLGYEKILAAHQKIMAGFWSDSDIQIQGSDEQQLAIRLNMLHLYMSAGRDGLRNIAAKGLTGPGYDGHYFWDSEIYIIPYFIYTQPDIARSLLSYRYQSLEQAKARAKDLGHKQGALFPWRTIGGEECSSYFPAGTAQYHINAAIAFAVRHYYRATDDWQFICSQGAELVFECARLWPSLGHFNPAKDGAFCLDTVTGPDEYTALVNNNYYTNAMAKIHLEFAVELVIKLKQVSAELYQVLSQKLGLTDTEVCQWQNIASKMYLPHDKAKNITPQDDSFLNKKAWDFKGTLKDKYPLLLHFHPLVIYRHQVLKQADVVLADFLQDDRVDTELKRNNLAYYEPITTHDSTLSACTHSMAFSELGFEERAYEYFEETLMTDLDNRHHNTHYGIHTAAMAGSWMCITQGFAGLRMRDGYASFSPRLPRQWQSLAFKLRLKGCQLALELGENKVSYHLLSGSELTLSHYGKLFELNSASPSQTFDLPSQEQTR